MFNSKLSRIQSTLTNSNPRKINLGVGVYKDEAGKTPVLDPVKTWIVKVELLHLLPVGPVDSISVFRQGRLDLSPDVLNVVLGESVGLRTGRTGAGG